MQTWRAEALKTTESPFNTQQTPDEEAASVGGVKVAPPSQLQRPWWEVMARHKERTDLNIGREERWISFITEPAVAVLLSKENIKLLA